MSAAVVLPAVTAVLALTFALALLDQWRDRRRGYQLVWAVGMLAYAVAAGCEALAGASGWTEALYKTWYVIGVATPAWLGLGTAFLVSRTRFGYTYGVLLALSGVLAFAARAKYTGAGDLPAVLLFVAVGFGLAIGVETYFQDERWPVIAAAPVVLGTVVLGAIVALAQLPPPGYALNAHTNAPVGDPLPAGARLLALPLDFPGALALVLGALFSAYVFMPKRRVLAYSLDTEQPGDQFLFNLLISPVAIAVNLAASLPGAIRAIAAGRIHSRVPATLLIAVGGLVPLVADSLAGLGDDPAYHQLGTLVGIVLIFAGFLVSIETFSVFRIPFTRVALGEGRVERAPEGGEPRAAGRPGAGGVVGSSGRP